MSPLHSNRPWFKILGVILVDKHNHLTKTFSFFQMFPPASSLFIYSMNSGREGRVIGKELQHLPWGSLDSMIFPSFNQGKDTAGHKCAWHVSMGRA